MFANASSPETQSEYRLYKEKIILLTVLQERRADLVDRLGKPDTQAGDDLPAQQNICQPCVA